MDRWTDEHHQYIVKIKTQHNTRLRIQKITANKNSHIKNLKTTALLKYV